VGLILAGGRGGAKRGRAIGEGFAARCNGGLGGMSGVKVPVCFAIGVLRYSVFVRRNLTRSRLGYCRSSYAVTCAPKLDQIRCGDGAVVWHGRYKLRPSVQWYAGLVAQHYPHDEDQQEMVEYIKLHGGLWYNDWYISTNMQALPSRHPISRVNQQRNSTSMP
jgi:hypothetical protein